MESINLHPPELQSRFVSAGPAVRPWVRITPETSDAGPEEKPAPSPTAQPPATPEGETQAATPTPEVPALSGPRDDDASVEIQNETSADSEQQEGEASHENQGPDTNDPLPSPLFLAQVEPEEREAEGTDLAEPKQASLPFRLSPPSGNDLEVVSDILAQLKTAFDTKNISALERMSDISPVKLQLLERMFRDYPTVKISVSKFYLTGEFATVIVAMNDLTDQSGRAAPPQEEWRHNKVLIKKEGERWGKVIW